MGRVLTYSRNVFVPVTGRCRNRCGYCAFRSDSSKVISRRKATALLEEGARKGCTEALFSMGDRPWELPDFFDKEGGPGRDTLPNYLVELCELALEAGLLPHTNAGVLEEEEMRMLAPYNASMGLMLETTAEVKAHRGSPGKVPSVRLAHIAAAGRLRIPFTTGILVGIGETWADRARALEAIARLHEAHGHIQEVIVQGFDPKPGTEMASCPPPDPLDLERTVALARRILPGSVAVQVPPNLADPLPLIEAGADDLGGLSPVTPDWINPDRPWPALDELRLRLRLGGYEHKERLPVYPGYIKRGWHGRRTHSLVEELAGPDGLRAREGER